MASSRESSPGNDSSPSSPVQLTPNSKVKALLAAFDDNSDEEAGSSSAKAKLSSIITKKATTKSPLPDADAQHIKSPPQEPEKDSSEDEDGEEDDIIRPVGRMAARMHMNEDNSEPEVEKEKEADDARERVRTLLMTKSKTPEPVASDKDSENNDNSDASIVQRKRKVRVPRRGTPASSPERRSASPALFVSPTKSAGPASDSSDADELPPNPLENERFKALVEKKRQERLEKEAREAEEKAKKTEERRKQAAMLEEDDVNDDFVEQRLAQQSKPTRKAGKKAIERMAQETQRLSRNTQLAHQPKTKKKITKVDLFKVFNFRAAGSAEEEKPEDGPTSSSPAPHSDVEMHETPPTSPASHGSDNEKPAVTASDQATSDTLLKAKNQPQTEGDEELPTLEEALASSSPKALDKGKGKAIEEDLQEPKIEKKLLLKQRPVRIRPPVIANGKASAADDSDSDLEILTAKTPDARKKKLDNIFDRIPAKQAKESHSLQALKMLAHLKSPGKQNLGRNQKPSLTTTELQFSLQHRARQQAAREREERLEALKAKGVIVQTAEEREKALAEVEDLMAKARREGEEIRRKEKAAAKKERREKGEEDPLADSSDDEDWKEGKDTIEELSGSGSEDEDEEPSDASGDGDDEENEEDDEEEDEYGHDQAEAAAKNPIFDDEAEETDDDEAEAKLSAEEDMAEAGNLEEDEEDEHLPVNQQIRRARKSNVISDDEDDDEANPTVETASRTNLSTLLNTESPIAPNSVLRSATKTFIPGLTVAGPAGLGLTQIFAGTMDESQIDAYDEASTAPNSISKAGTKQNSLAFLRGLPAPDLPPFVPTMEDDSQDVVVDSQPGAGNTAESQSADTLTQRLQLCFSQSQVHGFDSIVDHAATQFTEFPEATQDAGFQCMTPIRGRFVEPPPSTVDTVVMGQESAPQPLVGTPLVKKKGKLLRRAQVAAFSDEEDTRDAADSNEDEDDFEISANVFDVMRKASKKKEVVMDEFDKKTSKAKEMVHEQAEESEDEYAGLGGASDDGSDGEEDEYVKEMIDDEVVKDMDKSKLAAFFA
jgi:mediator of replication checkpoint protein 1